MPRLNEPIKISSRPPWLGPRHPFWRHQFAGGNAFMLTLMTRNADPIEPHAEPDHFEHMIAKSRQQLGQAAKLRLTGERNPHELLLRVEVQNLAGHKFPTGHPYRRAWLHVRVLNKQGVVVFESGAVDHEARIAGLPVAGSPHFDEITRPDQVQVYEAIMAEDSGQRTWSLLRAASLLKDNRLPPKGFHAVGEDARHISPVGVEGDLNFNSSADGRDVVTYRVALAGGSGPVAVEARLLYQSVSPEAVERLLDSRRPLAREFSRLYSSMKLGPELVQEALARF